MNPITIEALEMLDAIDRRGSFAKASEELNKATSALSYGVQKLEEQLGITVFERQGRRSVLTPSGRLLLNEGRKIINSTTILAQKAKEVATGWEPRIRIAIESTHNHTHFFERLGLFLGQHESLEVDVSECSLSGGWESLEHDRVDLIIGAPGPVPLQKGYRAVPIIQDDMIPVIAAHHPMAYLAGQACNQEALLAALPNIRRVVTHDSSRVNITRNVGFSIGNNTFYVQTLDQKIAAQLAGIGIGHLPLHRIKDHLKSGRLLPLNLKGPKYDYFIAWKISNKGKALKAITQLLTQ